MRTTRDELVYPVVIPLMMHIFGNEAVIAFLCGNTRYSMYVGMLNIPECTLVDPSKLMPHRQSQYVCDYCPKCGR